MKEREERIFKKPDGTYVLVACKSVGIDNAYPHVKNMHGFTPNGFPKGLPNDVEQQSIWTMFASAKQCCS